MDVVEITADLVSYDSASQNSNTSVSEAIARWLHKAGLSVERIDYTDRDGTPKTNVVGKKGKGQGGPRPSRPFRRGSRRRMGFRSVQAQGQTGQTLRTRQCRHEGVGRLYDRSCQRLHRTGTQAAGLRDCHRRRRNRLRRRQGRRAEIEDAQIVQSQVWNRRRAHAPGRGSTPTRARSNSKPRQREKRLTAAPAKA